MATFDEIFTKSNLEESQKKAKMLFGRLLISLRKTNHIKLYSLLESVDESDVVDGVLELTLSDKVSFDMMNNKNDLETLNNLISQIQSGLKITLKCSGKDPFDMFKFESRLKSEFGKLLTIKKD